MKQAIFRPLTPDKKPDFSQTPAPDRTLADLLPANPAMPPGAPPRQPQPLGARAHLAAGAMVATIAVFVLALMLGSRAPAAAPVTAPTAPPQAPSAPAVPSVAPQPPVPAQARLERPVAAFAAPDGVYLGILEAGRAYTPTARLGQEWTQIDADGSGRVWAQARELAPAADLPDLATPTPRPVPTAPPAPLVIEQPPAPTRCAVISGGGIVAQACGVESDDVLAATAQADWDRQWDGSRVNVATMTPWR